MRYGAGAVFVSDVVVIFGAQESPFVLVLFFGGVGAIFVLIVVFFFFFFFAHSGGAGANLAFLQHTISALAVLLPRIIGGWG